MCTSANCRVWKRRGHRWRWKNQSRLFEWFRGTLAFRYAHKSNWNVWIIYVLLRGMQLTQKPHSIFLCAFITPFLSNSLSPPSRMVVRASALTPIVGMFVPQVIVHRRLNDKINANCRSMSSNRPKMSAFLLWFSRISPAMRDDIFIFGIHPKNIHFRSNQIVRNEIDSKCV